MHQGISWCIETAPNDCSTVGSERVLLHQIQAGSSYLEIVPLPQDRLLDAVYILVWHPVYKIHLLASVGPSWRAMMWYSSCPLMGSLTTALMLFMGNFSVLSLVPNHSWSSSILNVSLTFPPDLLSMPDRGTVGRVSLVFFKPAIASSGFPLSSTFLCTFCSLHASLATSSASAAFSCCTVGFLATSNTSFRVEPTTITFDPFTTPSFLRVISSLASPLIMIFCIVLGTSMMFARWTFKAPTVSSSPKVMSYFFLLYTPLKSTFSLLPLSTKPSEGSVFASEAFSELGSTSIFELPLDSSFSLLSSSMYLVEVNQAIKA